MERFFIGLDLGQSRDWTAISILEQHTLPDHLKTYDLRYLEQPERGTPYPDVVERVGSIKKLRGGWNILADDPLDFGRRPARLCGRSVLRYFWNSNSLPPPGTN